MAFSPKTQAVLDRLSPELQAQALAEAKKIAAAVLAKDRETLPVSREDVKTEEIVEPGGVTDFIRPAGVVQGV